MIPDLPPSLAERLPALRTAAHAEPLGLYLHVPFCLDRCTYCSFATTRDRSLQPLTSARLISQVRAWGAALDRPAVDTLYLGGGTPSLLSAAELAAAGIHTTLAADGAVAQLMNGCALLLVGADSIGDHGLVNKLGTHAAALVARELGVPAYAVADSTKLLPPGAPQPVADERPPEEVWGEAPAAVSVWNRYFEATPLRLFTGVVLEDAILSGPEVGARRAGLREPVELQPGEVV